MISFRQSLLMLLLISTFCIAVDGIIRFSGHVVDPSCAVKMGNPGEAPSKVCSGRVASLATITTKVVTPERHMLVWHANTTSQADLPVTQWKVVQLTYK